MTSESRHDTDVKRHRIRILSRINNREPGWNAGQGRPRKKNDVTSFKSRLKIRSTEGERKKNPAAFKKTKKKEAH